MNGIVLGNRIRDTHKNHSVHIIFISSNKTYSIKLHAIQPLDFIVKPISIEEIEKVIHRFLEIVKVRHHYFQYTQNRIHVKKRISDIIYIESNDRQLILNLSDGSKETFYGSLKNEFEKQLQHNNFLYIHEGYAVNFDYIEQYKLDAVKMITSPMLLPISKPRRSEIRVLFNKINQKREGL